MTSVAEVLDPLDRLLVEQAFGARVEQIYQSTEGFLAATCAHGSLHIQEDIMAIQEEPLPSEQRTIHAGGAPHRADRDRPLAADPADCPLPAERYPADGRPSLRLRLRLPGYRSA